MLVSTEAPRGAGRHPITLPVAAAAVAMLLAVSGCASSRAPSYAQAGGPVVAAQPQPPRIKVEIEDDGVPAQLPPLRRVRAEADDPREPFSRDYGSVRQGRALQKPSKPAVPPVAGTASYDSTFDADGVIARAIAEHEARVQ